MKLLIGEYLQQRESKLASMLKLDKDDDSEEWEYEGDEDDFFGNEELNTTDPELMNDPIYLMDLKVSFKLNSSNI